MKILHVTPHLGGGIGTVIMDWMDKVIAANDHYHRIVCLDYANDKAKKWAEKKGFPLAENMGRYPLLWKHEIREADIVLTHYWNHPMLADLFADSIPDCRLVFWCHKNIVYPPKEIAYSDLFINTSPVQGHGRYIWSTGNMDRFLAIQPKIHRGFNVGYCGTVDYKKMHRSWIDMCKKINIPGITFTVLGDVGIDTTECDERFRFVGKVDDVAPYLVEMDIFGYSLRPDHYGTCEIALGEAMAAGVVPVVMDNPAEKFIVTHGLPIARNEQEFIDLVVFYYHCKNGDRHVAWEGMKERARNRAKKLYSIDNMIQQWDEIFAEMIQKPKTKKEVLK
uniref:Putative glycosyltransferase n=1 Tax=viral metagenome TaxID=1070528 RepID=A0A6M3IYT9_9ZZZZ